MTEVASNIGDGPCWVVRGCFHEHRYAVRRISFIEDFFIVRGAVSRRALDRRLHLVEGHVHRARILNDPPKYRVVLRNRAARLHGNGDVLTNARKLLGHPVPATKHRRLPSFKNASHTSTVSTWTRPCKSD